MEWNTKRLFKRKFVIWSGNKRRKNNKTKFYDKNNILEFKNGTGYTREYYDLKIFKAFEIIKFEGEFVEGIKNGKGKQYNFMKKLEFDGEFLNGKRNGKGKEYDCFGKIVYEGEFLNGERHGKGKEYDDSGKIKFEGEYVKGKRKN